MAKDFFEYTGDVIASLNSTEQKIFDYVVKNMEDVRTMSIQKFAANRFVSTTTIFRFTKKLGFIGYADFINSLLVTTHNQERANVQVATGSCSFSKNYLENAIETVRVMSQEKVDLVVALLQEKPRIYILTDDNTHAIGQYCERLFIGLGFHAYFPETAYQRQNIVNQVREQDLIITLSYSGADSELLDFIQRLFLKERPHLLSITRADNNPLQMLSDTNFYVFTDVIEAQGINLTSNIPMLMLVELLTYEYMASN